MPERFATRFTIEWGDCDETGIVYYPRIFDLFDRSFQRFLRQRGLSQRSLRARYGIVGTGLIGADARFRQPLTHGDEVEVEVAVEEWQEKQFRLAYRIGLADSAAVIGHEIRAWFGRTETGALRALAIPQSFREAME